MNGIAAKTRVKKKIAYLELAGYGSPALDSLKRVLMEEADGRET